MGMLSPLLDWQTSMLALGDANGTLSYTIEANEAPQWLYRSGRKNARVMICIMISAGPHSHLLFCWTTLASSFLLDHTRIFFSAGPHSHLLFCWTTLASSFLLDHIRIFFSAGPHSHHLFCWTTFAFSFLLDHIRIFSAGPHSILKYFSIELLSGKVVELTHYTHHCVEFEECFCTDISTW